MNIGLLSWLFGTSYNPFVAQQNIPLILNGGVNFLGQAPGIIIGAFLVASLAGLAGLFYRRRRGVKVEWKELAALFIAAIVIPMLELGLLMLSGTLQLVLFLIGWGFGYLALFVVTYVVCKTLGD